MKERMRIYGGVRLEGEVMVSGGSILPYRVQPGDSLKAIAEKYHVSVDQLMKWNDIKDPSYLTTGTTLKIKF